MFADLLEEALDAWTDAREGVIAELENIPAERYDFRPAEEVRSVAELACHIMEVSELMVGELSREDTDFHRAPFPELLREHARDVQGLTDKEAILEAMERTLERGRTRFEEVGELHMLQLIERFDGEPGTRMAWMHHGIAQEMYHRGQLCTYERLMGLVPALTKRIRGED
ncbi:MAG: DinB family protein [Candidatus Palauibacterales bacterium]|nr:DinB family protein [Candidatus Palauibacterales bacterium]MDP2528771.1 DinB family protein [Candidatus Palauibacterales bacterium]MDP2584321.1 DinB family protein [Candidatus Palauibacterales bacterium]